MFKAMIHRTIEYVFEHKKTRAIMKDLFFEALEDPRTRKVFKEIAEKCIISYAKQTGYKL